MGRVPPSYPLQRNFGNFEEMSQIAVNMAIGSLKIHKDSQMAVA